MIKNKYEDEKKNKIISKLNDINSNNNNFDVNIFSNYIKKDNLKLSHLAKSEKKKKVKKNL